MSEKEISLFNKDTSNHELFAIKGKEAFIGYKIPNGNFCFESIPFTEPKNFSYNHALADSLSPFSKDKEIGLYEKFLDSFTDEEGIMKPCNPDAIFNFFANNVWR